MAQVDPKKLYKNKVDGQWYRYQVINGEWKPVMATAREIADYETGPLSVVPGDALSLGKRWKVASFSNDATALKDWLMTSPGVVVKPTGGGRPFDLAVSKDGGKTYQLIDPAPRRYVATQMLRGLGAQAAPAALLEGLAGMVTDPAEFGKDMLDIGVDLINGTLTGLATIGGAIAAPVTGGLAGAGTEYVRQQIGSAMGMNKQVDPLGIGLAGAGGAVVPAVGSVAKGIRSPLTQEVGAMLTGAKADTQIPGRGILKKRIRIPVKAKDPVDDVELAAAELRQSIGAATAADFPETALLRQMEAEAKDTINVMDLLEPMAEYTKSSPSIQFQDAAMPGKASNVMRFVYDYVRDAGVTDAYGLPDLRRVPAAVVARMKDEIWDKIAPGKAFKDADLTDDFISELRGLGGRMNQSVRTVADKLGPHPDTGRTYSQMLDASKFKMDQIEYWQQAAGIWEYETKMLPDGTQVATTNKKMLDDIKGTRKMVETIESLWGKSYHGVQRAIENLRELGMDPAAVRARMERAALSQKIGPKGLHGAMQVKPDTTAVGGVPYAGVISGLAGLGGLGGYAASGGNPMYATLGALGVPALAGTLTSPRFIIGAGKMLDQPTQAAIGAAASPATRAAMATALQELARQRGQRRPIPQGTTVDY